MLIDNFKTNALTFSFEIFPPKTPAGEENLKKETVHLAGLGPSFISVTYGAGGSTREKTLDIALGIRKDFGIDPLVHFTCVGAGRSDIRDYIETVRENGVSDILALRGDPPAGQAGFVPPEDGFAHADELVSFIKKINGFSIGVAGYPEGHIESPDLETDIINLKKKVDAGADYIITQLFYDNDFFYSFIDRIRKIGISVPVIPGIMPITNPGQIQKITTMCGATVPPALARVLENCGEEEHACAAGIEYSIRQCNELKSWGVPGIHFFTMNRSAAVKKIIDSLR